MAEPTIYETFMLELVNRGRSDPDGEASRYGIDLNEDLAPGTISSDPKPPLVMNELLTDSARAHSQWMLDANIFSHTGSGGSTPHDRMGAAGYAFEGAWTSGENISWSGTTADTLDLAVLVADQHEGLFLSESHRTNIMNESFREIGIGQLTGTFDVDGTSFNASMITQNFAASGEYHFIGGVVYADTDGNSFYTPGEGLGGVSVDAGALSTSTWGSGGYALALPEGTHSVTFSGGGLSAPVTRTVTIAGENEKVDVISGVTPDDGSPDDGGDDGTGDPGTSAAMAEFDALARLMLGTPSTPSGPIGSVATLGGTLEMAAQSALSDGDFLSQFTFTSSLEDKIDVILVTNLGLTTGTAAYETAQDFYLSNLTFGISPDTIFVNTVSYLLNDGVRAAMFDEAAAVLRGEAGTLVSLAEADAPGVCLVGMDGEDGDAAGPPPDLVG